MAGFEPPVYPYERLAGVKAVAEALPGGLVDLSIGTPCDPPADEVVAALSTSGAERGYPASIGSDRFRAAASGWLARRFGVSVGESQVAACVGTKDASMAADFSYSAMAKSMSFSLVLPA